MLVGSHFGGGVAKLVGATLDDVSLTPTDAEVGYQLTSGGLERSYEGIAGSYATIGTWLLLGAAGDYEVQCTVNSGTAPAGSATAIWLVLSTTRAWTLTDSGVVGPAIVNNLTIEIRNATSLTVVATATVTMSVHEEA